MNQPIVVTEALTYRYSKTLPPTLTNINLDVPKGSIYGFLGPNGSGKTTTLALLLGLLRSREGKISLFGNEFNDKNRLGILKKVGSLIENPSLYGHLTARENLEVYRGIYGVSLGRIEEVLKIVGLSDAGKKIARRFSLGMKQRLALALALMPNPELLILDEPTNGLDPQGIIGFREIIKRLNREEGMTILVSSHILSEIEKLVTHVGIIFKGNMVFQGSLLQLHQMQKDKARLLVCTSDDVAAAEILQMFSPEIVDGKLTVACPDQQLSAVITRKLTQNNLAVFMIQPIKNDLEQLFMDLTSNKA